MSTASLGPYLQHLNEWAGQEPESNLCTPEDVEPPVLTFAYRGQFGDGTISGFTYGLSSVPHPDWVLGRPELFITMDSGNLDWVLAVGYVATAWRGEKSYSAGDAFDLGGPISPEESQMSALLLFTTTDLGKEVTHIELPDRVINLIQLFPVYESELALLERDGAEALLTTQNVDFHDPRRPPLC